MTVYGPILFSFPLGSLVSASHLSMALYGAPEGNHGPEFSSPILSSSTFSCRIFPVIVPIYCPINHYLFRGQLYADEADELRKRFPLYAQGLLSGEEEVIIHTANHLSEVAGLGSSRLVFHHFFFIPMSDSLYSKYEKHSPAISIIVRTSYPIGSLRFTQRTAKSDQIDHQACVRFITSSGILVVSLCNRR